MLLSQPLLVEIRLSEDKSKIGNLINIILIDRLCQ